MRRPRSLTSRGGFTLLIGIGCVIAANLFATPILLYVGVLFVALVVFAALMVHIPRRNGAVARQISTDLLGVGEQSRVILRFDLRAIRMPTGLWRDVLPASVTGNALGEFPPESKIMTYMITGVNRGIWPLGPLMLRTVDPFGLAQREQAFGEPRTITIVPAIVPLAAERSWNGPAGGTAHALPDRLGQGTDNLSPRHYVSGDSMRRIHWRATAHRGALMVRQEEAESSPDALVVLDRSAAPWQSADPADSSLGSAFEAAVSLCASAAIHLTHEGYSVTVIDSAGVILGTLRGHEDDRDELLVKLAQVTPRGEAQSVRSLVGGGVPGPLVYITGVLDQAGADRLHTTGATAPLLFLADDAVAQTTRAQGWSTALTTADVAASWVTALQGQGGSVDDTR